MPKVKKLQVIGKFPSGEIDPAKVQAIVDDYLVENPPVPQITINGQGPDENGNFTINVQGDEPVSNNVIEF
jgi:hypothetical protein